jgi:pSer/pThr/pTyr-binding forkhead associated (FHA) protein
MQVRLIVLVGKKRTRALTLSRTESVLGRAHGCTVRIPSSEVSRRHCRLTKTDGFVLVEDLGSVNGTFINGRQITAPVPIRPGDELRVGPAGFVVEYALSRAAAEELGRFSEESIPLDVELVEDAAASHPTAVDRSKRSTTHETAPPEPIEASDSDDDAPPQVLTDDDVLLLPDDLQLRDFLQEMDERDSKR